MSSIRTWTDPTEAFRIKGLDLTSAKVWVTFEQGEISQTFTGEDVIVTLDEEDSILKVPLTQEITGLFADDKAIKVQVNWIVGGKRNATSVAYFNSLENLLKEILS